MPSRRELILWNVFLSWCANGKMGKMIALLKKDPHAFDRAVKYAVNSTTGFTALIEASYSGHLEVVLLLISNGANVEAASKDGYTALHIASQQHLSFHKIHCRQ